MSNSPLVDYTRISPNSSPRTSPIKKITIHHMAGDFSIEACGEGFASPARKASATYGIGSDGRVGQYVDESRRPWTSSSTANDDQAVTIEVANSGGAPDWPVSEAAFSKLLDLCVDICKRNNIKELVYTDDATGNLTRHNMFAATACPGPYLQRYFYHIAGVVNLRLSEKLVSKPSPWAEEACAWVVANGLFQGDGNGDYDWQGGMTREMLAVVLKRFADKFGG